MSLALLLGSATDGSSASSYPARYPPGGVSADPASGRSPSGDHRRPVEPSGRASPRARAPWPDGRRAVGGGAAVNRHAGSVTEADRPGQGRRPGGPVYVQVPAVGRAAGPGRPRARASDRTCPRSSASGCWSCSQRCPSGVGLRAAVHPAADRPAAPAGGEHRRRRGRRLPAPGTRLRRRRGGRCWRRASTGWPSGWPTRWRPQRQLAGASERARIARELHDSISQDLFSLRVLAGGLRRALPADSPLHPRVEAMERTMSGTLREMQALLLELRPVALRDAGLAPRARRAVPDLPRPAGRRRRGRPRTGRAGPGRRAGRAAHGAGGAGQRGQARPAAR